MTKLNQATTFNKWLTGFWEADGSIGIRTHCVNGSMYTRLEVEISQKDVAALQFIKDTLALQINVTHSQSGHNSLQFRSRRDCAHMLSILCQNVVSGEGCTKLNNILSKLNLHTITTQPPSIEWLAGFWQGDGTLSHNSSYRLSVTQNSVNVLEKIKQFTGFGNISHSNTSNEHVWSCNGQHALTMSTQIASLIPECSKRDVLLNAIERYRTRMYMYKHRLLTKSISKQLEITSV